MGATLYKIPNSSSHDFSQNLLLPCPGAPDRISPEFHLEAFLLPSIPASPEGEYRTERSELVPKQITAARAPATVYRHRRTRSSPPRTPSSSLSLYVSRCIYPEPQ
ncbi:hypothetical protein ACQJBY_048577 [Aegilops geniculata]